MLPLPADAIHRACKQICAIILTVPISAGHIMAVSAGPEQK